MSSVKQKCPDCHGNGGAIKKKKKNCIMCGGKGKLDGKTCPVGCDNGKVESQEWDPEATCPACKTSGKK